MLPRLNKPQHKKRSLARQQRHFLQNVIKGERISSYSGTAQFSLVENKEQWPEQSKSHWWRPGMMDAWATADRHSPLPQPSALRGSILVATAKALPSSGLAPCPQGALWMMGKQDDQRNQGSKEPLCGDIYLASFGWHSPVPGEEDLDINTGQIRCSWTSILFVGLFQLNCSLHKIYVTMWI